MKFSRQNVPNDDIIRVTGKLFEDKLFILIRTKFLPIFSQNLCWSFADDTSHQKSQAMTLEASYSDLSVLELDMGLDWFNILSIKSIISGRYRRAYELSTVYG
jgi:hypothetical protein